MSLTDNIGRNRQSTGNSSRVEACVQPAGPFAFSSPAASDGGTLHEDLLTFLLALFTFADMRRHLILDTIYTYDTSALSPLITAFPFPHQTHTSGTSHHYDYNTNPCIYEETGDSTLARFNYDTPPCTFSATFKSTSSNTPTPTTECHYAATSRHYYGYRQYSPELGRWLSRDPIGEPGGKLLYGFVLNRPTNATDSHGLFAALYPVLKALFGDCLKKLIEEKMIDGVSKYGDKLNACSAILSESKTDAEFSDKICDGITVSKNMESIYKKKSLAGLIVECMGSKAKDWGLDKLLKDATTDLEKKIVKELFELTVEDAAKKIDVGESKTVMNTTAACNKDKKVEIHLTYVTTWTVDGASIPLQSNDETPFTCGGFLTGAFNNMCKCCGDKK